MNDHLRTVVVAPMTTGARAAPFRTPLRFQGKDGLVLLDQIRTLDKTRLLRRLGAMNGATLSATLLVLRNLFED
jgi:mRNA interferase MazF